MVPSSEIAGKPIRKLSPALGETSSRSNSPVPGSRSPSLVAVTNGIAIVLAFISGVFIVGGTTPDWMNTIAWIFPLKHLNNAMLDVMVRGRTPEVVLPEIGILLGFAVVLTAISAKLFKWDSI